MDYAFHTQIKAFAQAAKGAKKQVALFLLEHAQDAAFMTVGDVAQRAGVSPGTVSKVAQAMGFEGFPDIQERIRQVIRSNIAPAARMEMAGVDEFDWEHSMQVDMENLRNLFSRNPVESLQNAAQLMAEVGTVHVMGTRSSYSLAHFLAFNLGQIRDRVYLVEPKTGQMADAIKTLRPGDLFVAVALPRYQRDTVLMTRQAHEEGCRVLSVTDSFFSPLAKVSEITLIAPCESLSFFNSYVAAFGLASGLITQAALYLKEQSADALKKSNLLHERYRTFFNETEPDFPA